MLFVQYEYAHALDLQNVHKQYVLVIRKIIPYLFQDRKSDNRSELIEL